jgi:hypothetical protein
LDDKDIMQPPTVANWTANPAPANQQNQQPHQNQQQFNPPPWWYNQNPPPFVSQPSQNIIVESRADKAKEQEAKLNTIMLSLFMIGSKKLDLEDGKIPDTRLPTNTTEYNNILSQPAAIRATQAANILHTCFMTSPERIEDRFSSIYSMLSMEFFPKNLVTAWLNANFQRSNLESLLYETNAITIMVFVSQNDNAKLRASRMIEESIQNEKSS